MRKRQVGKIGGVIPKDGAVQPAEGSPSSAQIVEPEIPRYA